MFRRSAILALFLLFVSLSSGKAGAEERVLRLAKGGHSMGSFLYYPAQIMDTSEDFLKRFTFFVYTAEEVNSKISPIAAANAQNANTIAELQRVVNDFGKNIKDLADIHDALLRRVEELEKKSASLTKLR